MLTYVTKSNAQRNGMVMWDEVVQEVAKDYPDVSVDHMLGESYKPINSFRLSCSLLRLRNLCTYCVLIIVVDAMTVRMVLNPRSLDTILATNLHADILSDLAAALAGSIGIAPTANLDPTRKNPSSKSIIS